MAWPNGTRLKTFVAGGSHTPGDTNAIEDRMLKIAGYRGASIIAGEHAVTSATYAKLGTTPGVDRDEVQGVTVPAKALLVIAFQALWKESADGNARAAIFIGANQLKVASGTTGVAPAVQEAQCRGTAGSYSPLASYHLGLTGAAGSANPSGDPPATTGQVVGDAAVGGGACLVFVAAGTYDISIQFKSSTSGTVTAKERNLWVSTIPHD